MSMILKILFLYLFMMPFSFAVDQLEVQGLFSGKAVVLVDGKRHILSIGETSPEGVKVISADSKSAVLEENGSQKTYRLGNTIHTNFEKAEFVREQIFANRNGMYLTHGIINGHHVKFPLGGWDQKKPNNWASPIVLMEDLPGHQPHQVLLTAGALRLSL